MNPHMSQGKLAKLVGCSRQFINSLEMGVNEDMGADLAICIADALHIPIRWLVRGDPLRAYVRLSPTEEKALADFRSLPPKLQQHFVDSVHSLAAIHPTEADPFPLAPPPPQARKKPR